MITSFYTQDELDELGFNSLGNDVLLSKNARIYSPQQIDIGNNVRIDDFCILSGEISLRSNIHIAPYCALYGAGGIIIEDFCGVSARSVIYSASDDYSGDFLIGPNQKEGTTNVIKGLVRMKKYSIIGTGCTVLPNVTIGEGCAVGAMSLVNESLEAWGIYAGIPAKKIKERNKGLLKFV